MATLDELVSGLSNLLEALEDLENYQGKTIQEPDSNYKRENETSAQLVNDLLEQTIADIDQKIDGYVYIIKQKLAQKEFYLEESRRLQHKARAVENSIRFLKSKLNQVLSSRVLDGKSNTIKGSYYQGSPRHKGNLPWRQVSA